MAASKELNLLQPSGSPLPSSFTLTPKPQQAANAISLGGHNPSSFGSSGEGHFKQFALPSSPTCHSQTMFPPADPYSEEADQSPRSSPVQIPRSREQSANLSRSASFSARFGQQSTNTTTTMSFTGLLPALPISPPLRARNTPGSDLSPPRTPSPGTPRRGRITLESCSNDIQHPWDTPGPSLNGSITSGRRGETTSPAVALHHARDGHNPEFCETITRNHNVSALSAHRLADQRALSNSPRSHSKLASPFQVVHSPYAPHRESYARGGKAPEDERQAVSSEETVFSHQLFDSEDEFLRNVRRIADGDTDGDQERTPSPYPGALAGISQSLRPSPFVPQPSPLGKAGPSTPQRTAGGEIDRLRAHRAELERQRQLDAEYRKPEYLKRWRVDEESPQQPPNAQKEKEKARRRPRTRGAIDTQHQSVVDPLGPFSWIGSSTRVTRARDAREAELAIAAVQASLQGSKGSVTSGRIKSRNGHRKAKDRVPMGSNTTGGSADSSKRSHRDRKGKAKELLSGGDQHMHSPTTSQSTLPGTPPRPSTPVNQTSSDLDRLAHHKTTVIPGTGLGIAVSPIKGRRIKLMRPSTPDPSTACHPSTSISTADAPQLFPAATYHSFPTHDVTTSELATNPLLHHGSFKHSSAPSTDILNRLARSDPPTAQEVVRLNKLLSHERASKKRKRLAAFQDDSMMSKVDGPDSSTPKGGLAPFSSPLRNSPLKPAQVEGLGRMAINPDLVQRAGLGSSAGGKPYDTSKTLLGQSSTRDESLISGLSLGGAGYDDLIRSRTFTLPRNPLFPAVTFTPSSQVSTSRELVHAVADNGPHWPDHKFPWSLNLSDRKEKIKESKARRMELVERFLDRGTDDESESDEDGCDRSAQVVDGRGGDGKTDSDTVVEGARGLWALNHNAALLPDPGTTEAPLISHHTGHVLKGSEDSPSVPNVAPFVAPRDPSDARSALASRRDVRMLLRSAAPHRQKAEDDNDGEILCVCRGPDDGRAMVCCDGCKTWSHQICVDIHDESQLGECWFCWRCAPSMDDPTPQLPKSSPTFVQAPLVDPVTEDAHPAGPFLNTQSTPKPTKEAAWSVLMDTSPPHSYLWAPKTPVSSKPFRQQHSSSFVGWSNLSNHNILHTPSSHMFGPRELNTPRFFDDFPTAGRTNEGMDPMSTPSRGTKYGVPFVSTASAMMRRMDAASDVFSTPKAGSTFQYQIPISSREPGLAHSATTLQESGGPFSPPVQHYSMHPQYQASPVQRRKGSDFAAPAPNIYSSMEPMDICQEDPPA